LTATCASGTLVLKLAEGFRILLAFSVLAAMAWLCWKGAGPGDPFAAAGRRGLDYLSVAAARRDQFRQRGVRGFRSSTCPGGAPGRAEISWRAFRHSQLSINGVVLPPCGQANWKDACRRDAASYLRPGTNTITATVWNSNGPPALSLRLEIDGVAVKTDGDWSVSVNGSLWRQARLASASAEFGEGNELHGLEETGPALRECWPRLFLFFLSRFCWRSVWRMGRAGPGLVPGAGRHWRGGGLVAAILHNAPLLPREIGFDSSSHVEYIAYVQEHRSLPSPETGMGDVSRSALLCGVGVFAGCGAS